MQLNYEPNSSNTNNNLWPQAPVQIDVDDPVQTKSEFPQGMSKINIEGFDVYFPYNPYEC